MKVIVLKILKFLDENDWQSAEAISKQFNMTRQEAAQHLVVLMKTGLIAKGARCRKNGVRRPVLYSSVRFGGDEKND